MDFATFTVDGKEYSLHFDFNELCDAETATGCNLLSALESLGALTARQLRGLLYAMIVRFDGLSADPGEAMKQMGALIRIDTAGSIMLAIGMACAMAAGPEYAAKYGATLAEAEPVPEEAAAE